MKQLPVTESKPEVWPLLLERIVFDLLVWRLPLIPSIRGEAIIAARDAARDAERDERRRRAGAKEHREATPVAGVLRGFDLFRALTPQDADEPSHGLGSQPAQPAKFRSKFFQIKLSIRCSDAMSPFSKLNALRVGPRPSPEL